MQVEFNNKTMEFETPYVTFPAPKFDIDTAEDLKTYLMSDMSYSYFDNDFTYYFTTVNNNFVKIVLEVSSNYKTVTTKYIVTFDSLFKAIDNIVDYFNDDEHADPDYEDDDNEDDEFYEYNEYSDDEE